MGQLEAALQTKLTYYNDAKQEFPITSYENWGELAKNMEDGYTYSYNIHQDIYKSYKQFMPENEVAGMLVIMKHATDRIQVDFIAHINKRYTDTVHADVFYGWTLLTGGAAALQEQSLQTMMAVTELYEMIFNIDRREEA